MEVWTEVLNERLCDVHVGDFDIIVPLQDSVTESEAQAALEYIEHRKAREQRERELDEIQRDIEERAHARGRLEDAGYEPSEIPL